MSEQDPIYISPSALFALNNKVREWTGWPKATLKMAPPTGGLSPFAETDFVERSITADPEELILNPNRVLLTVTPFRLRQEAVLTGTLLHEAGHARHSRWLPSTPEEAASNPALHSDGTAPTEQTVELARLMEEPRIEGIMATETDTIGAAGLAWTMRASAARLLAPTELSHDPSVQIMQVIQSWALRAGRQVAFEHHVPGYKSPSWVNEFTSLLHQAITAHLEERADRLLNPSAAPSPGMAAINISGLLHSMARCVDDTGPSMLDMARDVLALLFPETDDEEENAADGEAMPSLACASAGESGEPGEGESEEGEGASPSTDDTSADESDEPGSGGDEAGDEADEPGDGGSEGESDESEGEGEQETEAPAQSQALAEMEAKAKAQTDAEAATEANTAPPLEQPGSGTGAGPGGKHGGSWRTPDAAEREVQKGAMRFLREQIDASETSKRSLTDQPSANVDGSALAAWKAGGQVREPHFFVRTRRNIEPSPPIRIAILVDVSASMDSLQAPSALLSWALASAALDLRNFAGRGQQIESCLIHWGDSAKVVQRPGEILPGIRKVPCDQGTSNMHGALDEIEAVMPGFFDHAERPVNRLIVQFTDWKLFEVEAARQRVARALEVGVNMLSIVPSHWRSHHASLDDIMRGCPIQRGRVSTINYNSADPGSVWSQATQMLDAAAPIATKPNDAASSFGF